jgi:hypothetical protein
MAQSFHVNMAEKMIAAMLKTMLNNPTTTMVKMKQ